MGNALEEIALFACGARLADAGGILFETVASGGAHFTSGTVFAYAAGILASGIAFSSIPWPIARVGGALFAGAIYQG